MRAQIDSLLKADEGRLSRRGETVYYFGALFFAAGITFLLFASASIMFFQIHYGSEAKLIADTVTYMGSGLFFVSFGINLMLRQTRKGTLIYSIGSIFVVFAIILFYQNYETNWFYPTISYILLFYLVGFLMLMGNAFGQVTLWILRKSQQTEQPESAQIRPEYTDEQIQRDIDNAIKESIRQAAEDLQFDLSDAPSFRVSSDAASETIVKRKDTMNETMVLQQTLTPGAREKWGGTGIDKASLLLQDTLTTDSSHKKGFFSFFQSFFSKK